MAERALLVYRLLRLNGFRVITGNELRLLCRERGILEKNIVTLLIRKGALDPLIFKGVYYVRSESEMLSKTSELDLLRGISLACNKVLGKNWYFGLHTALNLNDKQLQVPTKIFVITRKQIIPGKRKFSGVEVIFSRIKTIKFNQLIIERNNFRISNLTRTALDFIYLGIKTKKIKYAKLVLAHIINLNKARFNKECKKIIDAYQFSNKMQHIVEEVCRNNV